MALNDHVYAIYCQPEVDDNVISGGNVKIIEGYIVVNFEAASSRSFRDFPFVTVKSATAAVARTQFAADRK